MTIEAILTQNDLERVIRYIDTHPVAVSVNSPDAVTHDVERYCAFRQDELYEREAQADYSVAYLSKAREDRVRLMASIDKYAFPCPCLDRIPNIEQSQSCTY